MKSVLISIQPKWCELIASGKKTVEVRKTKPKLETPFKVYIYCTKDKNHSFCTDDGNQYTHIGNGKVIGEFVCDRIINAPVGSYCRIPVSASQVDVFDLLEYADEKTIYGWHISDLKIYDKPRKLSEFYTLKKCNSCKSGYESSACIYDEDCRVPSPITRPFQSWGYVESEDTE